MPRILLAGVIILAVLMSGCKIGGSKASNAQAQLRLLHVAALNNTTGTTTSVNMTVDTTVAITGLTFGSISNYTGYDSGTSHVFQILLSDGSAVLQTDTFVLGASTDYTLVLYGSSTTPGSVLITDTNTLATTLNSGYFQFRPVHSAISVPQMDLYLIPMPANPTQLNATFQTSGPTFTGFTITGIPPFQQFPATGQSGTGQYVIFVTSTGSKTILYQSPPITFNPNDIVTGDVYSLGSGSLVNMILMYQDSNNDVLKLPNQVAQIKFTNASAAVGTVNEQVTPAAAVFQASISGTTMTVTSVASGTLVSGAPINGAGVIPNTIIVSQLTGTTGSAGTYQIYPTQSVGSIPITTAFPVVTPFSGVPYGGTSSYSQVQAGTDNVAIINNSGIVAQSNPTLAGSGDYSTVLIGTQLLVLSDNNLPPSSGDAKIRFVNATADAETIDVQVNFLKQVTGLTPATASAYLNFTQNPSPGDTVTVNQTGSATIALTSTGVEILAGSTYTFYVIGSAGSLQGILSKDN